MKQLILLLLLGITTIAFNEPASAQPSFHGGMGVARPPFDDENVWTTLVSAGVAHQLDWVKLRGSLMAGSELVRPEGENCY